MPLGGSTGLTYTRILESILGRPLSSRTRSGRAIFVDTFECYTAVITEKWKQSLGTIVLASDYPKTGLQCMKLTTGTALNDIARARFHIGDLADLRIGLECEIQSMAGAGNIVEIGILFRYYDATDLHEAGIKWLGEANKKFQYFNNVPAYADITGGDYDLYVETTSQPLYHNFKLVADLDKGKYIKFICNEQNYDLSELEYSKSASALAQRLEIDITIKNAIATVARIMRVDNVILTDQEP